MHVIARALTKRSRAQAIVDAVSFELDGADITALLGPSGSGKTTLLRLVMGLEQPDAGELLLNGEVAADRSGTSIPAHRRQMSLAFQDFALLPHLDLAENVAFGLRAQDRSERLVDELLELLELTPLRRRSINTLSGGEQQRAALARCLAVRPRLLLLDEPFSNVDKDMRERLHGRLKNWLLEHHIAALLATHDHAEAFFMASRILVMRDGRLIDDNSPRGIYRTPSSAWVARFFGEANLLDAAGLAHCGVCVPPSGHEGKFLLRPEDFELAGHGAPATVPVVIEDVDYLGFHCVAHVRLENAALCVRVRMLGCETFSTGDAAGLRLRENAAPHPVSEA